MKKCSVFDCDVLVRDNGTKVTIIDFFYQTEADLESGADDHAPSLFFAITCFFAITLRNYKLCYLK